MEEQKDEIAGRMERKGIVFGEAKPVICVPVIGTTDAAILEQVKELADGGIPMVEWRMDWYEKAEDSAAVTALLKELAELTERTLLLCTYRTRAQGGEGKISPEAYRQLNLTAAESGAADLVDLEYYQVEEPERQIRELQERGVWVVCSHHEFQKTPGILRMESRLLSMAIAGGDFSKLAVMPQRGEDVLRMMEAVIDAKRQRPEYHYIAVSMGELGAVSRLLGGWYGSEVTFAADKASSAPGQLPYPEVERLLEELKLCGRAI
ncbi:MAG: type I 3-dehydroquinate dehydratase [Lachnospiraceae bacterium]|nr:type I 3-dehydroquinate dehydratase [Lachnospiraceae bacterium]